MTVKIFLTDEHLTEVGSPALTTAAPCLQNAGPLAGLAHTGTQSRKISLDIGFSRGLIMVFNCSAIIMLG